MGDSATTRPVTPDDAADVRNNCFSMNTLEEVQDRIAEALEMPAKETGVQLVAEFEGAVIGTASVRRESHPLRAHRAELDDIVVHGDYWRRGFARQLVEECFRFAQSLGIEIVEVSVRGGTPAEHVYRRLGFIEYGRLPRGLLEPWGDQQVFDEVFFYQPVGQPRPQEGTASRHLSEGAAAGD